MKRKQVNPTFQDIELELERKLTKMYHSFPDAESEAKIERHLASQLGGDLAKEFFK